MMKESHFTIFLSKRLGFCLRQSIFGSVLNTKKLSKSLIFGHMCVVLFGGY
ncbi:hypothetical protein Sjap_024008 [Stephania japonica]|uniref:Uncharacterized protein n=1 Tax=Stephania japonica TaxID=461633 RepID=A0AAP0ECN0_9MAGN